MIYLADFEKLRIKEEYEDILSQFSEKVRERIMRFRQEEGRLRALTREVLLRGTLFEAFGAQELVLAKNPYGKPFIKSSDFHFNLSHSGTVVLLGTGNVPIGVDVERTDHVRDYRKLLRFFSEAERKHILSAATPEDEFYRIWTFREAFSKEEGVGLTLFEKEDAAIDYDNRCITFRDKTLRFYEYPYAGYKMTVCTQPPELATDPEAEQPVISAEAKIVSERPAFLALTALDRFRWKDLRRAALLANIREQ